MRTVSASFRRYGVCDPPGMKTIRFLPPVLLVLAFGCDDSATDSGIGGSGGSLAIVGGSTGDGASAPTGGSPGSGAGSATGGGPGAGGAPTVPGGVLFFDDFEYDVGRETADKFVAGSAFVDAGWSYGKDAVLNGPGAGGWLYTVTSAPGTDEAFPGVDSARALVVESGAGTYAGVIEGNWRQTDFYLQYGDTEAGPLDTIPSDVWFQHWLYIADASPQVSLFPPTPRLGKWIYPTRNGFPSNDLEWLFSMNGIVIDSETESGGSAAGVDIGQKSLGLAFNLTDSDDNIYTAPAFAYAQTTLGSSGTDPNRLTPLSANQWWLVRVHIDHSSANGVVEVSARPRGGDWIELTDTETSATVEWTPSNTEGHRGFRFPTTMSNWFQEGNQQTTHGDWWIYIDDFAIARGVNAGGNGVDDLPSYP